MKNNMLILGALIITTSCYAQQGSSFRVEQTTFYEVKSCVPNSDLLFYSKNNGGKMLRRATTDERGYVLVEADKQFTPAFALSDQYKNKKGVAGNRVLTRFDRKEFAIEGIGIAEKAGLVQMSWRADINPDEAITFEVLKSTDGTDYTVAETLPAAGNGMQQYIYSDNSGTGGLYKIRIVNAMLGPRYTTDVLVVPDQLKVYPTIASGTINVSVPADYRNAEWHIIDTKGQTMLKGAVSAEAMSINIASFATGSYYLLIKGTPGRLMGKFIVQ